MQLQVLISFFFAYMAAVQAAPIQLPAGGLDDVPSVPNLPNVARAISPAEDVSIPAAHAPLEGVKSSVPILPHDLPVLPRGVSPLEDKELADIIALIVKRQELADALPSADNVPDAFEATGRLPKVPESPLSSVGKRFVDPYNAPLADVRLCQLDGPEPSLPAVPSLLVGGDPPKRQVNAPSVAEVGDILLPDTPSVPAKLPVRAIDAHNIPLDDEPQPTLPGTVVHLLSGGLIRRQIKVPETPDVNEISLPTTPSVPPKLPVRAVVDALSPVEVPEVPVDAAKLAGAPIADGLAIRQLPEIPEVPELPTVPNTGNPPTTDSSVPFNV